MKMKLAHKDKVHAHPECIAILPLLFACRCAESALLGTICEATPVSTYTILAFDKHEKTGLFSFLSPQTVWKTQWFLWERKFSWFSFTSSSLLFFLLLLLLPSPILLSPPSHASLQLPLRLVSDLNCVLERCSAIFDVPVYSMFYCNMHAILFSSKC